MTAGKAILYGFVLLAVSALFARSLTFKSNENPVVRGIARGTRAFLLLTIPAGIILVVGGAVGFVLR